MISSLHGEIAKKTPESVVIAINGVGYEVAIPLSTYEALPVQGEETSLLTHLHVRENELSLFGFATEQERQLFRLLQDVNRVGPTMALQILSGCSVAKFKQYVVAEDEKTLSNMVKGIGKKTARRLVMELKPAMEEIQVEAESARSKSAEEAVEALVSLGSNRTEAQEAVNQAVSELGADPDSQDIIRKAVSKRQD